MSRDSVGGGKEEVPAGGSHPEAVQPHEHRQVHRHRRSETAGHDRHGIRSRYDSLPAFLLVCILVTVRYWPCRIFIDSGIVPIYC